MEPTVLENLRVCLRAKKLQPAEVVGALSENYHGYAQVRARARRRAGCIRSLEPSLLTRTLMRVRARPGAGTRLCRSRAPCACASAVQMANLIRDWHCFLGDEPKDVDREIRCETYAIPSCAPVAPPCACVGIMTCSTWLWAACMPASSTPSVHAREGVRGLRVQHPGKSCSRLCMSPQCMRSSAQVDTDAASCKT